jgi:hypothetical protein
VDDLKCSHKDPSVNDKFSKWLEKKHGNLGKVKIHRGKVHNYLGMMINFEKKKKMMIVDMRDYVTGMLESFPIKLQNKDTTKTPAEENLFGQKTSSVRKLDKKLAEAFHTTVAQGLFLAKRARPDLNLTIAYLCTQVQSPNEQDWAKLIRMMQYLNGTRDLVLTLSADNLYILKWYVDVSYAVHQDYKSHTGGILTMGRGAINTMSRK